ncbi:26S proteasome non-ATPase regulatory subunit 4-like [Lineus longissimus]|uniref:26S proteasome non-ATPase regulatory subunit 4-like n=1 Tax=Lineus longissimus TaxID=88925 RepID=UPI002B4F48F8
MVLESTMICVDNSDFMRNGDFLPTRLQAQQDAVNLVCHSKTRSNPENNVGLLTLAKTEVLATLTTDVGRILSKLHQVQPKGITSFISGVRIAHLALKHRQGKNHKLRIIIFVGSPIEEDEKELVKLAKRLKKEKVNVDVVNFGEENLNTDKLTAFVNTINGKDGTSSHLVTVPPGPLLSDALVTSPIIVGEDGSGAMPAMASSDFEFGVDPNVDPELALALRVSMEEQRARQEEEARKVATGSAAETPQPTGEASNEEALLEEAIKMSMRTESTEPTSADQDVSSMTEEEQIEFALRMSMQMSMASEDPSASNTPAPMETDDEPSLKSKQSTQTSKDDEDDYSEVMNDPAFLQSVLGSLPGVDPQSEAIQKAMGYLTQKEEEDTKNEKDKDKDKDKDKNKK